jgi:hypothetical protein
MSSEQIAQEAVATTQTRKRYGICVGQPFCLGSVTKSLKYELEINIQSSQWCCLVNV